MPAADSAPGECFYVARYRLLHHTAVFFVSSDIRVFADSADGVTATAAPAADNGRHDTSTAASAAERCNGWCLRRFGY